MQKKLFFFHTFALVTAMAILLAVNSGVLHVVMDYYQRRGHPRRRRALTAGPERSGRLGREQPGLGHSGGAAAGGGL